MVWIGGGLGLFCNWGRFTLLLEGVVSLPGLLLNHCANCLLNVLSSEAIPFEEFGGLA